MTDGAFFSSGGFLVPEQLDADPLALDLGRIMRNARAVEAARLAGETHYLCEGFLGAKRLVPLPGPPAPPTRLERLGRGLREGRRRVLGAVYVLRTGGDYDYGLCDEE